MNSYKTPLVLIVATSLTACGGYAREAPVEVAEVIQSEPVEVPAAPKPEAVRLLKEINLLQAEIRQLRNLIEQQQFDVENIKQRQQDLYQGLDQRLRVAETRQVQTTTFDTNLATSSTTLENNDQSVLEPLDTTSQVTVGASTVVVGSEPAQVASVAPTADQQELYDQGFSFLRQSNYNDAIVVFNQLVQQHPDGGLADDASYWIGEANYVNRQYAEAIRAFRSVVSQYPSSDRVPEALLKVGYVQYDIGDYTNAKTTFDDIIRRYPDHPVAISADSRLQRIERGLTN